ncbi:MAG: hypothetical protein JNM80_09060 [Phycisphaerae bacterium]|nr:hypothetical protein [Phycisphaerae bacterium]
MKHRMWMVAGLAAPMAWVSVAMADVTAAHDRVPGNAVISISMKNVGVFYSSLDKMAKSLRIPASSMGEFAKIGEMMGANGFNKDGSAAIAIMSLEEKDGQGPVVMVLPVSNYAAYAATLGGKGAGLEEVMFGGEKGFLKDIGGGFAALGPVKEIVESFTGKPGNGAAHEALMGTVGKKIADASDAFISANIEVLAPKAKEGMKEMKEQMAMMGGPQADQLAGMMSIADDFLRDASAAFMGFKATDFGISMDFGAQFKGGTEMAEFCKGGGNSQALTAALPNQPFLFAMAMDVSTPGMRSMMKKLATMQGQAAGMFGGVGPMDMLDKADGVAFSLGQSPALMGGLFLNTTMFAKTSDPAGYSKAMKDAFAKMNGQSVEGTTFTTSYQAGASKVGETPVDSWGMKMAMDPDDPNAAMMGQMQMMLFGPTGLSGYVAPVKGGVVMTYSKNSALMDQAMKASQGGEGMAADAGVKGVAERLPAGRSMEMYIGVKSIMETAVGFMGMMGGGPANFEVPQDLPPIGIGAVPADGGLRASVFVPSRVISAIKSLVDSMEGEEGEPAEEPKDKTGQPKF